MWGHRMHDSDLSAAVEVDIKVPYCSDWSDFPQLTYPAENLKNAKTWLVNVIGEDQFIANDTELSELASVDISQA